MNFLFLSTSALALATCPPREASVPEAAPVPDTGDLGETVIQATSTSNGIFDPITLPEAEPTENTEAVADPIPGDVPNVTTAPENYATVVDIEPTGSTATLPPLGTGTVIASSAQSLIIGDSVIAAVLLQLL